MMHKPGVDAGEDRGGMLLSRVQPCGAVVTTDLRRDGIEGADEGNALLGNRRGAGAGDLDQLPAGMGPALGELDCGADPIRCEQPVVSGIAIDLQDTAKSPEDALGMLTTPTEGIGEGHARRCRAAPRSVISGQAPELSRIRLSRPRIKDRGAGLVHEQLR